MAEQADDIWRLFQLFIVNLHELLSFSSVHTFGRFIENAGIKLVDSFWCIQSLKLSIFWGYAMLLESIVCLNFMF